MKILIIAAAFFSAHSAFAASETKEFDSNGLNEVFIKNPSGNVTISEYEGTKAIVLTTKNKFSNKCNISLEKLKNKLNLIVEKNNGIFTSEDCNVDFVIKVPKTVDLSLELGSSNIKINGIEGALNFKLGSGNLSAEGFFEKMNGNSGSGNVKVIGLTGSGQIRTGSGNVFLTFTNSPTKGTLDIKTGSGNATVLFPEGSKVKTSFHAGFGQVSNELGDTPQASFVVTMKAGAGNLKIKSN